MYTLRMYEKKQREENIRMLLAFPYILFKIFIHIIHGQNHK